MASKNPALIMIQGPEPGSVYRLPDNRITTIGRSSQNKVTVVNRAVSRFHAEVACVNGQWELTDLNSRRGTMVNNEWIGDRVTLHYGDIIRMSSVVFRFDEYERGVGEQAALLAIKEAELDKKLVPKGEADIGMDEIMMRSRLESQSRVEARRERRIAVRANTVFLAAVAAVTLLGLGGTLLWAHGLIPGLNGVKPPEPPANAPANESVVQANEPPAQSNEPEPANQPAETTQPADEDAMPLDRAWAAVESALEKARAARLEANYTGALAALDAGAGDEKMPPGPADRISHERQTT